MLGALAGDIIGSRFEHRNYKGKDFELFHPDCTFTDDSVHTVALAESLLTGRPYSELLRRYYRDYPEAGYGGMFHRWAGDPAAGPYNSFGNGSAMRVSPVGWFFDDLERVLEEARRSAAVTHNHPEGIKGAQAVAATIYLARQGKSKSALRRHIAEQFGYHLDQRLDEIRPGYRFDVTCQGSVPQAFVAFLEATDFEDAVRNAVSLGGDSDTLACIAGSLAEAFYGGVPEAIRREVFARLDPRLDRVTREFLQRINLNAPTF